MLVAEWGKRHGTIPIFAVIGLSTLGGRTYASMRSRPCSPCYQQVARPTPNPAAVCHSKTLLSPVSDSLDLPRLPVQITGPAGRAESSGLWAVGMLLVAPRQAELEMAGCHGG
jgi:hypothetical protein